MFSIENLSICSSCFFSFFFVHFREAIHGFEFFLHFFFFNFLASTFPQLASCCFEFFLHFFSYDFSFIFCIHLSPTVILFNKEKLSMISSFSFNFFLSSFFLHIPFPDWPLVEYRETIHDFKFFIQFFCFIFFFWHLPFPDWLLVQYR